MKRSDRIRRGISFGTIFIICLTILIAGALMLVLPKLQGNTSVDIDAAGIVSSLKIDGLPELTLSEIPIQNANNHQTNSNAQPTAIPAATPVPAAVVTETPKKEYTLTFGGSIMLESGVNKSCYYKEAGAYDYTDLMYLLAPDLQGDAVFVSLENLITSSAKVGDVVAPDKAVQIFSNTGISHVMLGFPHLYDQGLDGISSTINALQDAGVSVIGSYSSESSSKTPALVQIGGCKAAVLHYTDDLTSKTKKKIKSDKNTWAIPMIDTDAIASDISAAKSAGASLVIVSLNWGKDNKTKPTDDQKKIAQSIADAGADVIIGTGSKTVQKAEYLSTSRGQTLVCYSLGCLICDSRDSANVAGMLLHLNLREENGKLTIAKAEYTPTYTWYYKQDKQYYYRVLASNQLAPDGMSSESLSAMTKALVLVQKVLDGAPISMKNQ